MKTPFYRASPPFKKERIAKEFIASTHSLHNKYFRLNVYLVIFFIRFMYLFVQLKYSTASEMITNQKQTNLAIVWTV